jgi:hypothetical protein
MFGDRGSIDIVHERLECGRRVAQAKEHYRRFVQSASSLERCFVLVSLLYPNVVVSLPL